jgi:hypothetical protein
VWPPIVHYWIAPGRITTSKGVVAIEICQTQNKNRTAKEDQPLFETRPVLVEAGHLLRLPFQKNFQRKKIWLKFF